MKMGSNARFKVLSCLLVAVVLSIVAYNSYFSHYMSVSLLATTSILIQERTGTNHTVYFKLDHFETLPENRIDHSGKNDAEMKEVNTASLSGKTDTRVLHVQTPHGLKKNLHRNDTRTEMSPDKSSKSKTTTSLPPTRHYSGYIVALKIYEQQTMATGNLVQLQCLASRLNLSVVMPLMKDSNFITPLDELKHSHMLQLDSVYSMQEWEEHTKRAGYAPLVKWEEFMEYAPRDVILVQMKYPTLTRVRKNRDSMEPHTILAGRERCGYKHIYREFTPLRKKLFSVAHNVCYNFQSGEDIPLEVFRKNLLGVQNPHKNVTVIIDEWRGLGENQRVLLQENICTEDVNYREKTQVSSKILKDARVYTERYLKSNETAEYLAVIARYEMTGLTRNINNKSDPHAIIPYCLQETLNQISELQSEMHLTQTFLSMDIGKYGSKSFAKKKYFGHLRDMETFVSKAYQGKMNITDWERTFEDVTDVRDSGYISMLQQVIVARAKCILFVGGGTFQEHTLHLYNKMHANPSDRCARIVKKCTSASRPVKI